jgi:hypothetical protein
LRNYPDEGKGNHNDRVRQSKMVEEGGSFASFCDEPIMSVILGRDNLLPSDN